MKYQLFSYGSNNKDQLSARLGRDVKTTGAYAIGYARVFRGYSRGWQGGVASLIKDKNKTTYGLIIRVNDDGLDLLDQYEGVASGNYRREKIRVCTQSDDFVDCFVYLSNSKTFNEPTESYLDAICKTINQHWFSSDATKVTKDDLVIR